MNSAPNWYLRYSPRKGEQPEMRDRFLSCGIVVFRQDDRSGFVILKKSLAVNIFPKTK
jgi:hypothetical protein